MLYCGFLRVSFDIITQKLSSSGFFLSFQGKETTFLRKRYLYHPQVLESKATIKFFKTVKIFALPVDLPRVFYQKFHF